MVHHSGHRIQYVQAMALSAENGQHPGACTTRNSKVMNIVSEDLSTDIVSVPSAIRIEVGGVLIHISSETPVVLLKTVLQEVISI